MNAIKGKNPFVATTSETQVVKMEQEMKDWAQYSRAIAAAMTKRMAELGLSQQMLANKMNCTQQYISKVLKGEKNFSLETLCKIERALGIEIIRPLDDIEQQK